MDRFQVIRVLSGPEFNDNTAGVPEMIKPFGRIIHFSPFYLYKIQLGGSNGKMVVQGDINASTDSMRVIRLRVIRATGPTPHAKQEVRE